MRLGLDGASHRKFSRGRFYICCAIFDWITIRSFIKSWFFDRNNLSDYISCCGRIAHFWFDFLFFQSRVRPTTIETKS